MGKQIDGSPHSKDIRQKMRSVRGRVPDFSEMRRGYDVQMEGAGQDDEDFLHWRPSQLYRVGCDDSERREQHWRHSYPEIQTVPVVYVTHAVIQNISEILLNALHA